MTETLEHLIDLNPAEIVFRDGTTFSGYAYGSHGVAFGQVEVLTAPTGYQEMLSDPAQRDRIVLQAFPHAGNTGINSDDYESEHFVVSGFITKEVSIGFSNFRAEESLDAGLKRDGVVGIHSVDTRAIARYLQQNPGAFAGIFSGDKIGAESSERIHMVENAFQEEISRDVTLENNDGQPEVFSAFGNKRGSFAVIDFGIKRSLISFLQHQGFDCTVFPQFTPVDELELKTSDGIIYASGTIPFQSRNTYAEYVQQLVDTGLPVYGFGTDNLIFATVHGIETTYRPFGDTERTVGSFVHSFRGHEITATPDTPVTADYTITRYRLNDYDVEGARSNSRPYYSQQMLRERAVDNASSTELFQEFIAEVLNK